MRYVVTDSLPLSPYILLNVGGSFLQLEPDPELQARVAVGASYSVGGALRFVWRSGCGLLQYGDFVDTVVVWDKVLTNPSA